MDTPKLNASIESSKNHISIEDLAPVSIIAINKNALVTDVNKAASGLINKPKDKMLGRRLGESINCSGSIKDSRGCGFGPTCPCELSEAIHNAISKKQTTNDIILPKKLIKDGAESGYWFKSYVSPVSTDDSENVIVSLFDISKEINEQNPTSGSRNIYQNIVNQMPSMMILLNPEGYCEFANKVWSDFTGISTEEAVGMGVLKAVHPDDVAECRGKVMDAFNCAVSVHHEIRIQRHNGEYRWCMLEGAPYYEIDGSLKGYIIEILDISERRNLEKHLHEKEEIFKTIFDQAPIGISIEDFKNKTYIINPTLKKIIGRTDKELDNITWRDFTHPDDLEDNIKAIDQIVKEEINQYTRVKRYIKSDGSIVYVNIKLTPLKTIDPLRKQNLCLVEDITDRVHAGEELRQTELRNTAILNHSTDVITIVDINGNVKYVSPNVEKCLGWSPEDVKAAPMWERIHPEDRKLIVKEGVLLLKKPGSARTVEFRYLCKDGSFKNIELSAVNLMDDDSVNGILLNYHDITLRKKKEKEVQYLNYHDQLTGLYNRGYFELVMERFEKLHKAPLSIITGDIDGLKLINNSLGQAEGDKLICKAGEILQSCLRETDVLARTGGGEFVILMPDTDSVGVEFVHDKIKQAISLYKENNPKEAYHMSISFGHATRNDAKTPVSAIVKVAEENMYRYKLLQNKSFHSSLINSMKTTMNEKSQETNEHAQRLIDISKAIGAEMRISEEQLNELELLSTLHDIGKIGIKDNILNKPGKLDTEEWVQMKKHPEIGYRIAISSPELAAIAEYILTHHEHWDGNGYPQGLRGVQIPLVSRIISVADAFDAMTQDRAYRKAMSIEEAVREIKRNAGTQFDPEIVRIFTDRIITGLYEDTDDNRLLS